MGIRVHKVVGYGLTDVKTNRSGQIIDKRFDPEGWLLIDDEELQEDERRYSARAYKKFLEQAVKRQELTWIDVVHERTALLNRDKEAARQRKFWAPYRSLIHEGEFGLQNVLIILPFADCSSNHRYDNLIDWAEEISAYRGNNRVVELSKSGIYPYNTGYWDPLTRSNISTVDDRFVFNSADDLLASGEICWSVPKSVEMMCKYLNVFKYEETISELRPLLYVYWA